MKRIILSILFLFVFIGAVDATDLIEKDKQEEVRNSDCTAITCRLLKHLHPFIEVDATVSKNFLKTDLLQPYGTIDSDFNKGWGINTGVRFREDKYFYHPGVSCFYSKLKENINFNHSYGSVPGKTDRDMYGISFDNYIHITYDKPTSIDTKYKTFVVLGLKAGTIKSTYNMDGLLDGTHLKDNGELYGASLAYLNESDGGLGLVFDFAYLYSTEKATKSIIQAKVGLRYTF